MDDTLMPNHSFRKYILTLGLLLLIAGTGLIAGSALASRNTAPADQASPIHPQFALLDAAGNNVLDSGQPVSTMKTCGECHDTTFIASHSFHSDLGLTDFTAPGAVEGGRPWDQSNGLFGKWNPLTYRYLSAEGDERLDLSTADWLMTFAARVVGGGPAVASRTGSPLTEGDPASAGWDWQQSGVMEMDCFLCHLTQPNNTARVEAIQSGQFGWANTATLDGTGIVEASDSGWQWNAAAFDADGKLAAEFVAIQDPTNENCAQCHGVVHTDPETPLVVTGCALDEWQTATTGQVIAAQKISNSGVNLSDKEDLARSWDIHAERGLKCTDCHYSLNNPAYYQADTESQLEHLSFDPRRLEIGEYLQMPDHNLARGQSAQFTVAPETKATMRRCDSCHDAASTHDWLPYAEQHMQEVACESCHIPELYAPAVQQYDWTVLQADGQPRSECRGVEGADGGAPTGTLNDLVTGYQPVLLSRQNVDGAAMYGDAMLAPYNLVAAWYWVYDSANGPRPVALADLQAAWLVDDAYAPEILELFDANGDGTLDGGELVINTPAKQALISGRLAALGLANPHIVGEIQPYSINHNVTRGEWAVQDCQACHNDASRVTQPIELASYVPGDVMPEFVQDANTVTEGSLYTEGNALYYQPTTKDQRLYIFGHSRVGWIDGFGALFFVGVLLGVAGHGGLRFYMALRSPHHKPQVKKVYLYAVYERFWHWLQTFAIVLLLFTGLIIHRPDIFGFFSFRYVVIIHNVLAVLLVINAALSLFYHLVSGEIQQFIPRPYGFFDQAIVQAKFYLQGIFKGGPHPFEKTREKKMNPLQQATYFGILNVLLPLQILTGALMWSVEKWPQIANLFGGLPFLAPFHSLIAWTFAAFIVGHVYLTTTGHKPLGAIEAMMNGWDEVEVHTPGEPAPAMNESANPR